MKLNALAAVFAALAMSPSASDLAQGRPSPSKVQVGYCTQLRNLEAAKAAGFDYVELGTTEIANLSDADFEAAAARIKALGIATPAANNFLPATLKVTGPQIDQDAQMAH